MNPLEKFRNFIVARRKSSASAAGGNQPKARVSPTEVEVYLKGKFTLSSINNFAEPEVVYDFEVVEVYVVGPYKLHEFLNAHKGGLHCQTYCSFSGKVHQNPARIAMLRGESKPILSLTLPAHAVSVLTEFNGIALRNVSMMNVEEGLGQPDAFDFNLFKHGDQYLHFQTYFLYKWDTSKEPKEIIDPHTRQVDWDNLPTDKIGYA